ncbi:MAG: DNA (cytosine-5-)-methyltransferase [Dolichospermum sp.]
MLPIKFVDLFAGIGAIRLGLEQACQSLGFENECVLTSEIKTSAIQVYQENFQQDKMWGDITTISTQQIPDFDILLAGFPCQPFSSAGTRQGFLDTRGTLFFEIERILKDKSPFGFLLENVEGLVQHDDGRTLTTIVNKLEQLGYQVKYDVLNAKDFGVPQDRKRVYIAGTKKNAISLDFHKNAKPRLLDILETGCSTLQTNFAKKLLQQYSIEELYGKSIKDKRGGEDNIHSWDLELKGNVSLVQRELLNLLLKQRRRKIWSAKKGIHWMDGIPLTVDEIATFYPHPKLAEMLDDLANKGYLKYEHPKDIQEVINKDGNKVKKREYRFDLPKGYNIVVGKLSFPINKVLAPDDIAPTLVATDMQKLAVVDGDGLRCLTIREGLRLFGFPENYHINLPINKAFDLLGNTVVVPIVREIAERIVIQKMLSVPKKEYVLTFL